MAKLRMTYKTLKALRKSREYQALLIDLVNESVVSKAVAENLLGYNIPSDLLPKISSAEQTEVPVNGGTEGQGSGTEGQGSGTEGQGSGNTVTLLYYSPSDGHAAPEWLTAAYDLTDDPTGEGIITFAQDAFNNDELNTYEIVEANAEYEEGESSLVDKYVTIEPQPETLESGMLIKINAIASNQGKDPDPAETISVTLLYFDPTANDNAGAWLDHTYTPTSTDVSVEDDAIIAAAKTAFSDNDIEGLAIVALDNTYVEGTSALADKYVNINPQPTTLTDGMLVEVWS